MITIEQARDYLRIDEGDLSFQPIFEAAVEHVTALTNQPNDETAPKIFGIAVCLLTSHWFENRDIMGSPDAMPYGFNHLIMNLNKGSFF